jgi:cell division protein FtsL
VSAADAVRAERRRRRRSTLLRLAFAALVVLAMASSVWRWTVGEDRFRELEKVRDELRVVRAEKEEAQTRILQLQRRERITRYARERLGMHVATDEEVVLLPLPASGERAGAAGDSAEGEG